MFLVKQTPKCVNMSFYIVDFQMSSLQTLEYKYVPAVTVKTVTSILQMFIQMDTVSSQLMNSTHSSKRLIFPSVVGRAHGVV